MKIVDTDSALKAASFVTKRAAAFGSSVVVEFRFLRDEFDFCLTFLSCSSLSGSAFGLVRELSNVFGVFPTVFYKSSDYVCQFEASFPKEVQHD